MNNVTFESTGDIIENLPTDKNEPSPPEIQIVDTLFKQHHTTIEKLLIGIQDVILIGILFILFSIPQIDHYVCKISPSSSTSPYILIFVKALLFMLSFFLLKNIYIVRKT